MIPYKLFLLTIILLIISAIVAQDRSFLQSENYIKTFYQQKQSSRRPLIQQGQSQVQQQQQQQQQQYQRKIPQTLIRGVWLTCSGTEALDSYQNLQNTMKLIAASNINTVFVVVWNSGYTLFPSKLMNELFQTPIYPRFQGRDILQETIDAAQVYNISVYAWFEYGFAAYYDGAPHNTKILDTFPHWAAINSTGQRVVKNGFYWMNGLMPEVQNFLSQLFFEVVQNYDVDGVQGDDRFPAMPSEGGYDAMTSQLYQQVFGHPPPVDYRDSQWVQWRADLLTIFLQRFRSQLTVIDQKMIFSSAPSIYPFSLSEYLQDWPRWHELGLAETFSPQDYRYNIVSYNQELSKIGDQVHYKINNIFPGVLLSLGGGYVAEVGFLNQMVEANREHGFSGEVFFYNEGLVKRSSFFQTIYPQYIENYTTVIEIM